MKIRRKLGTWLGHRLVWKSRKLPVCLATEHFGMNWHDCECWKRQNHLGRTHRCRCGQAWKVTARGTCPAPTA